MTGITFGTYHSYTDLELILSSKIIGAPSVKTETVEVPGADGVLDFTEFFGEPKYNNRTLTFEFVSIKAWASQLMQDLTIKNALHGKKMKIVLDDNPNYYFYGRVSVGDWTSENNIAKLTITCDCDPWRYKMTETTVTQSITDSGTVTLSNLRQSVVPRISTDGAITIAWTGSSASLAAGDDQLIAALVIGQGNTTLTITGTATVTFKYQEGGL